MKVRDVRASAGALFGTAPVPNLAGLVGALLRHGPTLAGTVAWHAGRRPEQLALCDGQTRLTYWQLHRQVQDRVATLAPRVRTGWSVGLPPGEGASYVVTLLAALRLGLQVTLLPPGLDTPGTHEHLQLRVILRAEEGEVPASAVRFGPRAGRIRLLSSGSTGAPKPVRPDVGVLSALRVSRTLVEALGVRAGAPVLLPLPLWHGHGLATLALSLGLGNALYLRPGARPDTLWQVLAHEQIEVLVLVPTILHRLLTVSGEAPALRSVVCGSAPLAPDLACRTAQRLGNVLFNLYGTTETGLITLAGPQDLRASPDVVGRPLPGVRLRVASDGQVLVRGPRGWRPSGDLGQLDAGGHLRLLGRADTLMVIGGEKVWPAQLESVIASLPGVRACVVLPVPSPEYGHAPVAFVESDRPEQELRAALAARLPHRLRPAQWVVSPELPRTAAGKLARAALRDSLEAGQALIQ